MNALEKIVASKKLPVLFIGSGISRRYLYKYPNWEELLVLSFNLIERNGFLYEKYNDELSRQDLSTFEKNIKLGTFAERDFNQAFFDKKINLKIGNRTNPAWVRAGISPYKMFLSKTFKNLRLYKNAQRERELEKFKMLKNKISAVMTTNYDTFLEDKVFSSDYTVFIHQNDLFSSDSYNIAEIYKIHGCATDANSIVITERDYQNFTNSRKLIIAKMLTLFTESPIIFMGYSFTDENIQNIIADFIECLTKEQLGNIEDYFIFISHKKGELNLNETKRSIMTKRGVDIPITEIFTDNYEQVFDTLNQIIPGVSPLKIRATRRVVKRIVDQSISSSDASSIIVGLDKLDNLDFSEKPLAIAVGYKENILNRYGYGLLSDEFIVEDIIFNNKDFNATEMCQERFKSLPKTRLLPVFKYVKAATESGFELIPDSMLETYINLHNTFDKIIPKNIEKNIRNVPTVTNSDELKKMIDNIDTLNKKAGVILKNITILTTDEIREFLKGLFLYEKNEAMRSTHFKRCVMYLDLIENGS